MEKPILHTFQEWSRMGYRINKGSKHVSRTEDGECLFDQYQVTPVNQDTEDYNEENDPYKDKWLFT